MITLSGGASTKGKIVWTNDNLQEEELAKAETKQAAREAAKAAR